MKTFEDILVAVDVHDEHQRALQRAEKIAKRHAAKLTVVSVIDRLPSFWQMLLQDGDNGAGDVLVKARRAKLEQLAASVSGQGLEVTSKVLSGRPSIEIVREVMRAGHDLVLKNALAREEPTPLFFGSVDLRLLRNCPCPVWLVKPMPSQPFERIIAAVNPFPDSDEEKSLNRQIMKLAEVVSQQDGSELHLVGAWCAPGEPLLAGRVTIEQLIDYVAEWSCRGKEYIRQLLDDCAIKLRKDRIHYGEGQPDQVIADQVLDLKADLVVMGTVARTGISGLVMGNTAEKVLRLVECSVLTLKPDGFVAPLESGES